MRLAIFGGMLCLPILAAAPSMLAAEDTVTLPNCLLSLADEAEVPAQEAGVLLEVPVREGQQVSKGDLLARIDDVTPKMQCEVASNKLAVAKKEADDDVNIRYAMAAAAVAEAEYLQAVDANKRVEGTVPQAEVRRLLLKEREMNLSIEKAQKEKAIAGLQVNVSDAELKAAQASLDRHQMKAPLEAVVVELSRHVGEWVQPGDPVMRLVRVDQLRVEGFLNARDYLVSEIKGRPVTVTVTLAHGQKATFPGKIIYVKPLIEAGGEFLVRAEVDNRRQGDVWLLSPGLSAEMTIQLK